MDSRDRDEIVKGLPPGAIDMFRAIIRIEKGELDLPPDNFPKWAKKFEKSLEEVGTCIVRVEFRDDECIMSLVSFEDGLKPEPEPEAIDIHLNLETIGQLVRVLQLAKVELENADRRRRAAKNAGL